MLPDIVVGVVGAGWAAREHCRSLEELGGTRIAGVFDVHTESAERLATDCDTRVVPTVDDLLAMEELDAVIVATPSGVHREAMVPALGRGLAVFAEKPLSRSVEDAWAIVEAADKSKSVCAVGYQWRAVDALANLQAETRNAQTALLISQGIGITQARSWFNDSRLSGGLVFERVSHHIDLQRMIAGEVSSVTAVHGGIPLSGVTGYSDQCEDVISLTLSFESGAVGAIHVGWTPEQYPPTQSLKVFTTASAYDLDLDPAFVLRRQGTTEAFDSSGEHPFKRQIRLFLEAIRAQDSTRPACTAQDAAGTVVVATAAEKALLTGQRQTC